MCFQSCLCQSPKEHTHTHTHYHHCVTFTLNLHPSYSAASSSFLIRWLVITSKQLNHMRTFRETTRHDSWTHNRSQMQRYTRRNKVPDGGGAEAGRNGQECPEPAISHESLGVLGMHRPVRADMLQETELEAERFLPRAHVLHSWTQIQGNEQRID